MNYLIPIEEWKAPLTVSLVSEFTREGKPVELYARGFHRLPVPWEPHEIKDADSHGVKITWHNTGPMKTVVGVVIYDASDRPVLATKLNIHSTSICGGDTVIVTFTVAGDGKMPSRYPMLDLKPTSLGTP